MFVLIVLLVSVVDLRKLQTYSFTSQLGMRENNDVHIVRQEKDFIFVRILFRLFQMFNML